MTARPIRVLVVDDSAMVRRVLTLGLAGDPELQVIGAASNAATALEMLRDLKPDVVTLDVEMPAMNGLDLLKTYMRDRPVPTVIISDRAQDGGPVALAALEAGAVDVIEKPQVGAGSGLPIIIGDVCARVKAAARTSARRNPVRHPRKPTALPVVFPANWVIAIGASTGGVQALARILPAFPQNSPAMVIVQHMPEGFTHSFAQRLNALAAIEVREARDGDALRSGLALLAPGGMRHMEVRRIAGRLHVRLVEAPPVHFSRPSVDVLFRSLALVTGPTCSAAVLTGMGRDGAAGLLEIRNHRGRTVAQDEASSVVFGMPAAAQEAGAAETLVPLDTVPAWLLRSVGVGAFEPPTGQGRP